MTAQLSFLVRSGIYFGSVIGVVPDQLLRKLLDRVRKLLVVDTTAVLLLDPSAHYLVATAARGLEEEVSQGVRIPLGEGFAGRIGAAKSPVVIDQVDHSNVLNPLPREKGVQSLLGVPLLVGGRVLGGAARSPPATSPAATARSAGTGTTRSCSRPGTCGS
jgi:transcriptional regulator with GAF, ATPase, and Fis domain